MSTPRLSELLRGPPEAVCATDGNQTLTYQGLSDAASRLARALAGERSAVGIRCARGPGLLVALLGVLGAERPALLVPASLPAPRLADRLARCGARLVLADASSDAANPQGVARWDPLAPPRSRAPSVSPGDGPALLVYSSGSMGTPVAHALSWDTVVGHLDGMQALLGLAPGHRMLQRSPLAFIVAIRELLLPLRCGGAVVFPRDGAEPVALLEQAGQLSATHVHLLPSLLEAALAAGARIPASLEVIMVGGEAPSPSLADRLKEGSEVRLLSLYGLTECGGAVLARGLLPGDDPRALGTPLAGIAIESPPVGEQGELVLRGPFGRVETGDRVSRAGGLRWLGRLDRQIKIGGVRADLDAIEASLVAQEGVERALVLPTRSGRGLDAWATGAFSPSRVHRALAGALPSALVPRRVIAVDALPRTVTNKPKLTAPPGSALAVRLVGVFSETLERPVAGVDVGFFELGGHSLDAVMLVTRVREVMDREVSVEDLLAHPTPRLLARLLASRPSPEPPGTPGEGWSALGPSALCHWLVHTLPVAHHTGISLLVEGPLDVPKLEQVLDGLRARHPALRTELDPLRPRQRVAPWRPVPLVVRAISVSAEDEPRQLRRRMHRLLRGRPTPDAEGRLEARLYRLGPERWSLQLRVAHALADGFSQTILRAELAALYEGAEVERAEAPPQPSSALVERVGRWREAVDAADLLTFPAAADSAAAPVSVTGSIDALAASRRAAALADLPPSVVWALALRLAIAAHLETGPRLLVQLMDSGRRSAAALRAVGDYEQVLPLLLSVAPGDTLGSALASARGALGDAATMGSLPWLLALAAISSEAQRRSVGLADDALTARFVQAVAAPEAEESGALLSPWALASVLGRGFSQRGDRRAPATPWTGPVLLNPLPSLAAPAPPDRLGGARVTRLDAALVNQGLEASRGLVVTLGRPAADAARVTVYGALDEALRGRIACTMLAVMGAMDGSWERAVSALTPPPAPRGGPSGAAP